MVIKNDKNRNNLSMLKRLKMKIVALFQPEEVVVTFVDKDHYTYRVISPADSMINR